MAIKVKTFHLRKESLEWVGQVTITSDWMFSCVGEYWNFSFTWRSFWDDFRVFLCDLNVSYFSCKMFQGMAYVVSTNSVEKACHRFAEKVLPVLQETLRKDIEKRPIF